MPDSANGAGDPRISRAGLPASRRQDALCASCETRNTVGAVLGAESSWVLGLGGTAWPGRCS
jgi:hypothetical protein